MINQLKTKIILKLDDIIRLKKNKLINKNFSIISNNCVGGIIYHEYGLKFQSPTIDLFFFYPDYVNFLERIDHYLHLPLQFKNSSNHLACEVDYPVGILDDVEIHFLHYKNNDEAKKKWEDRTKRINWNNLFIIGSDRDNCCYNDIEKFDNLPYLNKVFFASKPYPNLKSVINIDLYKNEPFVGDMIGKQVWLNYFNLTLWLNTGKIKRYTLLARIFNYLFI